MLRRTSELTGFTIRATDGEIGSVDPLALDDERWTVRHLVVDARRWPPGRRVLVSPIAAGRIDRPGRAIAASLTCERIERSPDIDADKPVSRRQEEACDRCYGRPYDWPGAGLRGAAAAPAALAAAVHPPAEPPGRDLREARGNRPPGHPAPDRRHHEPAARQEGPRGDAVDRVGEPAGVAGAGRPRPRGGQAHPDVRSERAGRPRPRDAASRGVRSNRLPAAAGAPSVTRTDRPSPPPRSPDREARLLLGGYAETEDGP